MKYLHVNHSDGTHHQSDEISNEDRLQVSDGDLDVFRLNEMSFQQLAVSVEDAAEGDDGAVEIEDAWYTFETDSWVDVNLA